MAYGMNKKHDVVRNKSRSTHSRSKRLVKTSLW